MIEPILIVGEKNREIKEKINELSNEVNTLSAAEDQGESDTIAIEILRLVSDLETAKKRIEDLSNQVEILQKGPTPLVKEERKQSIVTYQNLPKDMPHEWRPISEGDKYWAHYGWSTAVSEVPPEIIAAWNAGELTDSLEDTKRED